MTSVAPVAPPAVSADAPASAGPERGWPGTPAGSPRSASSRCRSSATTAPSSSPGPSSRRCGWSIFGKTFSQLHAIPTGGVPYLDFLAPGVLAQSTLFVAVFYGIQVIWERDAGVLSKLMVTPTPRVGPRHRQGVRRRHAGPRRRPSSSSCSSLAPRRGAAARARGGCSARGSWPCSARRSSPRLSMTIAGLVLTRERLMGIGQAITMPLFFASNALYPVAVMPGWLQVIARVNPLSYEVERAAGPADRHARQPLARLRRAVAGRRAGHPRRRRSCCPGWCADAPAASQAVGPGGAAATIAV